MQTKDGSTARKLATQNGHIDIVKNLIEANAYLKMEIKDSIIALILACSELIQWHRKVQIPMLICRPNMVVLHIYLLLRIENCRRKISD